MTDAVKTGIASRGRRVRIAHRSGRAAATGRRAPTLDLRLPAASLRSVAVLCVLFSVLGVFLALGVEYLPLWMACLAFALPLRSGPGAGLGEPARQWWFKASALFLAFASLSLIWTPQPAILPLVLYFGFAADLCAFLVCVRSLSADSLATVRLAALVGLVVAILMLAAKAMLAAGMQTSPPVFGADGPEGARGNPPLTDLQLNAILIYAVAWSGLAMMDDGLLRRLFGYDRRPRAAALVAVCLVFLALLLAGGLAPAWTMGSLVVSGTVFVFTAWKPRPTISLLALLTGGYFLFAPTLHLILAEDEVLSAPREAVTLSPDAMHTDVRWRAVATDVFNAPIFGHGAMAGHQHGDPSARGMAVGNIVLQIWYEFGLLGSLLAGLIVFDVLSAIGRSGHKRLTAAALTASVTSLFGLGFCGASLWDPWFLAALVAVSLYGRLALHRPLGGLRETPRV